MQLKCSDMFCKLILLSFFNTKSYAADYVHRAYRYNIKCQKCAGMGLNDFIFQKIIKIEIL